MIIKPKEKMTYKFKINLPLKHLTFIPCLLINKSLSVVLRLLNFLTCGSGNIKFPESSVLNRTCEVTSVKLQCPKIDT